MLRELITWPISTARTVVEFPRSLERSVREANELMDRSRSQLDVMRRQADSALEQAERMNDLLERVVRLTEPIEKAQRGGEFLSEQLKRALFGPETPIVEAVEAELVIEEAEAEQAASRPDESQQGTEAEAEAER